jgi:hypothetical protein
VKVFRSNAKEQVEQQQHQQLALEKKNYIQSYIQLKLKAHENTI